jgi:ribosomal-protein-alanine N-acetyltransferase
MPAVFAIEHQSFECPWKKTEFIHCLANRNCLGMVAEHGDQERVAGYVIYELQKNWMRVLNFAVAPDYRRRGVGSQMVAKLVRKLCAKTRNKILLETRETNLPAQMFFSKNGFRAVSVLRGFFRDTPEDAYEMEYCYRRRNPANRIAAWLR